MEYASALLFELGESFVRPTGVNATFDRLPHNYVAASMTLVDHSRKLMGKRSGRLAERFKERKKALLEHPEMLSFRAFGTSHCTEPSRSSGTTSAGPGASRPRARCS
jgi:hypothetical protein